MKRNYTIITIFALFICIAGIASYLAYQNYKDIKEHALISDTIAANLFGDLVYQHEKAVLWLLESYARRFRLIEAVKRRDIAETRRHMADLKKINKEIDLTFVSDKKGVLWTNFPFFPEAVGTNLSNRDWYKGVSAQWRPYISSVFKLIVGEKPLAVTLCVPVFDGEENIIGILANSQRLDSLAGTFQNYAGSSKIIVIDQAGQIIYKAGTALSSEIAAYPFLAFVRTAVKEGKRRIDVQDPSREGSRIFMAVTPLKEIGWTVIVERSEKDILRMNYGQFIVKAILSLLILLVSGLAILYTRKYTILNETQRRLLIEETLREELVKNKDLLNETGRMAKVGGWEFDIETLVLTWTDEVYRIHEVDMSYEPTVKKGINFYAPEARSIITEAVQRAIDHETPFDVELPFITAKGNRRWVHAIGKAYRKDGKAIRVGGAFQDITERKQAEEERERLISDLKGALSEVKTLSGMLPICASCKKIRNDQGYWEQIELYIRNHSDAEFSHGICPDCIKKLYPEYCKTPSKDEK